MSNDPLTQAQLLRQVDLAKQRIAELEAVNKKHKQTRADLEEAAQKYHNLFEHSGDSVLIIDLATDRIVETNTNASRRLGYLREELTQLTLSDIEVITEPDNTDSDYSWKSSFSGTMVYECCYRRKDGSLIPVEVSSRMVSVGGRDTLQNVVRDVSKRKQIEAEREQLIVELDAFAHTVAHDLKSPLALILGFAEMLALDFDQMPAEEVKKRLLIIEGSSRKMSNIVNELLLLASVRKLDEIPVEPLGMEAIVQESLGRFSMMIQKHQAEIILPGHDWPLAKGYGPWIEEVWVNYISNAIKYGGTPPIVKLGATVEDTGMVRYWVSDNGAGIPSEQLSLLFTQFQRLSEMRVQGYGLGLSIVQRIMSKLGGEIGVESAEGEGSVFSFTLPGANV